MLLSRTFKMQSLPVEKLFRFDLDVFGCRVSRE